MHVVLFVPSSLRESLYAAYLDTKPQNHTVQVDFVVAMMRSCPRIREPSGSKANSGTFSHGTHQI